MCIVWLLHISLHLNSTSTWYSICNCKHIVLLLRYIETHTLSMYSNQASFHTIICCVVLRVCIADLVSRDDGGVIIRGCPRGHGLQQLPLPLPVPGRPLRRQPAVLVVGRDVRVAA